MVHAQKLMLMQSIGRTQEQLNDDDNDDNVGPILYTKKQDIYPGLADISD